MKRRLQNLILYSSPYTWLRLLLLLNFFTCLVSYANSQSDEIKEVRISLELENASLDQAIHKIEGLTDMKFTYDKGDLDNKLKINLNKTNSTVTEILSEIGDKANLKFHQINNNIHIKKKDSPKNTRAHIVRGKVLGQPENIPLPGVSVYVKGTTVGTITDPEGAYTLTVPDGNAILIFSFLGYLKEEVSINNQEVIDMSMLPDITTLSEVVIVAYGEQKKESVVGAVSTVKVADIKTAAPRSLSNALAGRIAGIISVQRNGEPGYDDAQFWVRGISTFAGGQNPLVLVDGVERPLNNIEPEEIDNVSVLKDAAATAVYGIRGANGVILITTRRGINVKPQISLRIERGIKGPTSVPEFVDGPTYLNLYNEAQLASNPNFVTPYTPEIIEKHRSGEDPYLYPNVDWVDLLMKKTTNNQRANLNISGGSQFAKYFVSATYYSEDGLWKENNLNKYNTNVGLKRYNFRANTDINLSKNTELSLGLGGILVTTNYPGATVNDIWGGGIMFNTPVAYSPTYPNPDGPGIVYGDVNGVNNPYELVTGRGFATEWRNNIQSDLTLKHDLSRFVKGLKVQGKFAFDGYNRHFIQRLKNPSKYIAIGRDPVTNELILDKWFTGQDYLGFSKQSGGNRRIYIQANVNYDKSFGDNNISALLLYNQQDYQDVEANSAIFAIPYRYQGFVGRLSYNFKSKYFAELSAGLNGSENFEKGNRFGLFPALALGWIASEESFFKDNINFMEYLKFRGSYGLKGNDQLAGDRFGYLTTMGGGNGSYNLGLNTNNNPGSRGEEKYGVPGLQWEVERELNLGMEIRLLKGLYIQADIFTRNRTKILVQRNSLPAIVGVVRTPYANIGEFENKGFDATVEYRKKVGKLDVTFRGNYTYTRNKIINMDQPDWEYLYQNWQGKRFGQPFGLLADGLFIDEEQIASSPEQTFGPVRPGDIKYKDINGDGVVDAFDMVAIGHPATPEIVYGFGPSFTYKGFDLSIFFQGSANMSFMLGGLGFYPFTEGGLRGNITQNVLDRWTPENPRQDALFPRLTYGSDNAKNNTQASTWWQRDASYLRLRTAELGYTIPKFLTKRIGIETFRIYASGYNLWLWSKFTFWDPELGNGNGAMYPIQRNANFGINVNF